MLFNLNLFYMKKIALLLAFFAIGLQVLMAQTKEISGLVTSADDGGAIPGVSVSVKGTSLGIITDMDGKFKLKVPQDAKSLVFSFVGMATQEVVIGTQTKFNVKMASENISVDEVVVTALGISKQRKSLGYAVQEVSADDINKAETGNVLSAMTGRVAGVNITSSAGTAGASSFITIRGQNSITGNNQPLFVVDGLPIDNSMAYSGNPDDGSNNLLGGVAYSNRAIDINPDDIESVSVLKGGAATALYGMKAGNGVVLITTKKGSKEDGKVKVSLSSSISIDKVSQLPAMQSLYAQGINGNFSSTTNYSFGPKLSAMRYDGATDSPYDINGNLVLATDPSAKANLFANAYDNIGNFFQTGTSTNNTIAISGNSKVSSFYISIGNTTTNGIIPKNTFEKTSIKLSGDTKIGTKITVSGSANYVRSGGDRVQQGSNTSGVMLGLLRGATSFDNGYGHGKNGYKHSDSYMFPDGSQRQYFYGYDNPYWTVNKNLFNDKVDRVIGYMSATYKPTKEITVAYKLGDDFYSDKRKGHFSLNSANAPEGQMMVDHHYSNSINSDLTINFTKELFPDFNTNITIGNNMYESYYQQLYTQGDGFVIPDFFHMSNTESQIVRESTSKYRTAAFFADAQFSYKNMLYLGVTGRNEWSTTLPENNNSFFYPSVSLGFIFTELPALKDSRTISYGKIRASFAQIANAPSAYSIQNVYKSANVSDGWASGISFPYKGGAGFTVGGDLNNPTLKPERLLSREIGLELKFFDNRAGLDFTYYNNQNKDLLIPVTIAGSSGFRSIYMNAATMENKGVEMMATVNPIKTKDFSWNLTANFTKNVNKVKSLAEGVPEIDLGGFTGILVSVFAGESYGSVYSTGFYKDGNGNVIINDTPGAGYGYPIKDPNMKSLGSVTPKWTLGINNDFNYKGVSLSFLFDIKHGGLMWNGTKGRMVGFGTAKVTENRGESVTFEGVKGHVTNGQIVSSGVQNDIQTTYSEYYYKNIGGGASPAQEQFVEKTDWVRLREVTISYELGKIFKTSFLNHLSVYATGRNLWISTPYDGIDPETNLSGASNDQGFDYFNMPSTKSYVFGIKLDL
jgi:TonB-linked SusC/RagA family outer membrane protein